MKYLSIIGIGLVAFIFIAANSTQIYSSIFPEHFPAPVYDFNENPLSAEKIKLGRVLFYDPILSKDGSISCASCHSPYHAFAHTDHALSHGLNDVEGTRNAPPLFNLAWQSSFMWDGAIHHLDMQALAPLTHPDEMGESIENLILKLKKRPRYTELFVSGYGDSIVNSARILQSLAQFQLSLISASAKYDRVKNAQDSFSQQEQKGYDLFLKHCNNCHTEPLFTTGGFANNGLPVDTTLNDFGEWMITKQSTDSLLFKIPSLRNLKYTFPYMHDGRFKKLRQVLQHYSEGIQKGKTLSSELEKSIILSDREQTDLLVFLRTLNDQSFVFDKKNKFPKNILLPSTGKQK